MRLKTAREDSSAMLSRSSCSQDWRLTWTMTAQITSVHLLKTGALTLRAAVVTVDKPHTIQTRIGLLLLVQGAPMSKKALKTSKRLTHSPTLLRGITAEALEE